MTAKTYTIISVSISSISLLIVIYVYGYLSGIAKLQPLVEGCRQVGGM